MGSFEDSRFGNRLEGSRFGNRLFNTGSGVVARGLFSVLKGDLRATYFFFAFAIRVYSSAVWCVGERLGG